MQPGPLSEYPIGRLGKEKSFRLIDFGRSFSDDGNQENELLQERSQALKTLLIGHYKHLGGE